MRLYWACTHTTLRNTEVPLLIARGIEVVPEEANTDIVTADDALDYDADPAFERKWMARCTLSQERLVAVRRARLVQRDGLISEPEQALFNALFDVIYIPSFLAIAANVKSWFKGEVIFRYFGIFANLHSLDDQCAALDPDLVRQIYFLPIFSTLTNDAAAARFARSSILHPLIDRADAPPPWGGVKPEQSAVIVLYPLYEGRAVLDLARRFIPLAERIPVTILGRNDPALVPDDIKHAFKLDGSADRATHFQRMADARLLIYPHSSSHHMHYVPLEAVAAGIPLVCGDTIPLIREYEEAGGCVADMPGLAPSFDQLLTLAEHLFRHADQLPAIAARQADLPIRFQRDHVAREIDALKANLELGVRGAMTAGRYHPLSRISTTRGIGVRRAFARATEPVPMTDLVSDLANAALVVSDRDAPFDVAVVAAKDRPVRLMLGFAEDLRFAPGLQHEVIIEASLEGDAHVGVTAELWRGDAIALVAHGVATKVKHGSGTVLVVMFALDTPSSLVLGVSNVGSGAAHLIAATHRTGVATTSHPVLSGSLSGASDLDRQIRSTDGVSAALLANSAQLGTSSTADGSELALLVGAAPAMISLAPFGVRLVGGESIFTLTISGAPGATLEVVAESWTSRCEEQSRRCFTLETAGTVDVEVPLPSPLGPQASPVFYFRSVAGGSILILDVRLVNPA